MKKKTGGTGGAFGSGTAVGRPNLTTGKHPNALIDQPEHKGRWSIAGRSKGWSDAARKKSAESRKKK